MDPGATFMTGKGSFPGKGLRRKRIILWANWSMDDYETGMKGYKDTTATLASCCLGNRIISSFTGTGKRGFNGNGHGNETNVHFARIPPLPLDFLTLVVFLFL